MATTARRRHDTVDAPAPAGPTVESLTAWGVVQKSDRVRADELHHALVVCGFTTRDIERMRDASDAGDLDRESFCALYDTLVASGDAQLEDAVARSFGIFEDDAIPNPPPGGGRPLTEPVGAALDPSLNSERLKEVIGALSAPTLKKLWQALGVEQAEPLAASTLARGLRAELEAAEGLPPSTLAASGGAVSVAELLRGRDGATKQMRERLAELERSRGARDTATVGAACDLAWLMVRARRRVEGEVLYRRALRLREQLQSHTHADFAETAEALARLHAECGWTDSADALLARAEKARRAATGAAKAGTPAAQAVQRIAHTRRALGARAEEGEREGQLRAALARAEVAHARDGDAHPEVLALLRCLEGHLAEEQREADAREFGQRADAVEHKVTGGQIDGRFIAALDATEARTLERVNTEAPAVRLYLDALDRFGNKLDPPVAAASAAAVTAR